MAKKSKTSFAEAERRRQEIESYGKLVSLRPSQYHKSKKNYTRKAKHKGLDLSYFLSPTPY